MNEDKHMLEQIRVEARNFYFKSIMTGLLWIKMNHLDLYGRDH